MRTWILGSGTAFQDDGRGAAAIAAEADDGGRFLVDAGPAIMQAAARHEVDVARSDRLFLTHLHGDHVAGWPFLMLHLVLRRQRTEPFEVFGPPGTRRCLEQLVDACYAELAAKRAFDVRYHELEIASRRELGAGPGLGFDTCPMDHTAGSIGYRFRAGRQRIAVSGDTAWCDGLEWLARECDGLFLECTTLAPGPPGHVSLAELRLRRARLEVPRIVLVHTVDEVARQLALDPLPGVVAAHDGMEVEWVDD